LNQRLMVVQYSWAKSMLDSCNRRNYECDAWCECPSDIRHHQPQTYKFLFPIHIPGTSDTRQPQSDVPYLTTPNQANKPTLPNNINPKLQSQKKNVHLHPTPLLLLVPRLLPQTHQPLPPRPPHLPTMPATQLPNPSPGVRPRARAGRATMSLSPAAAGRGAACRGDSESRVFGFGAGGERVEEGEYVCGIEG